MTTPTSPPATRQLTEPDFSAMYGAAAFAEAFDLIFDTSVTIAWRLLSPEVEAAVPTHSEKFLKGLREPPPIDLSMASPTISGARSTAMYRWKTENGSNGLA
jgi:hypothetical protein